MLLLLPSLIPIFVLYLAIAHYFHYWCFCRPVLPVLFLVSLFFVVSAAFVFLKFVVATNDIFTVNIVVLVVTVVVASLTVIHINVKLQPLLQLFFLDTFSHQITEVQNPFFTECSPNLFCFFLDVSLTATLKWVPRSNLASNHNAADYSALKYLPMSGCSTSNLSKECPLPGKGNMIYDSSQVHRWIQVTLLSKKVPLLVEISTAWH